MTSVLCLFCRTFYREEINEESRKRKITANEKYFSARWHADNFSSHLKNKNPTKWAEYQVLSVEEKKVFFVTNENPEAVNLRSFVQPEGSMKAHIIAKQKCKFIIDSDIVNILIGELLHVLEEPVRCSS